MSKNIKIKNVSFSYNAAKPILNNISLEIREGTFLGIIGINGSGKSTFSYLLNGLIPNYLKGNLTGDVFIDGISTRNEKISFFAQTVGMVFQNPDFSLFNLSVREEIEFGLNNFKIENIEEHIINALKIVGMTDFVNRDPQSLSLGEKQKICLASILALDTKYLVLDEPVAMLDYKSSMEIYQTLASLNKNGKTIIAIEHDTDYLWEFAEEILILDNGSVINFDTKKNILTDQELLRRLGIKVPNYK